MKPNLPLRTMTGLWLIALLLGACGKPSKIEGRIIRSDTGQPIANAIVGLDDATLRDKPADRRQVTKTMSDKQGYYSFSEVKPGKYYMTVAVRFTGSLPCTGTELTHDRWQVLTDGYGLFLASGIDLDEFYIQAGQMLQKNIDLSCKPAAKSATISGKVFRSDINKPISDATVILKDVTLDKPEDQRQIAETTTDAQGSYSFAGVKPGKYYMTVVTQFKNETDSPCAPGGLTRDGWVAVTRPGKPDSKSSELWGLVATGITADEFYIAGDTLHKDIDLNCQGTVRGEPQTPQPTLAPSGSCETLLRQGVDLQGRLLYQDALAKYKDALTYCQQSNEREGQVVAYQGIGAVYESLGEHQEALGYFQRALDICSEVGDQSSKGIILYSIGLVHDRQGKYQDALQYYRQALDILREVENLTFEGKAYNNSGTIYSILGQYPEAMACYEWALDIVRKAKDRAGEAAVVSNIGSVHFDQGQYHEALESFQQALSILRETEDKIGEGAALNNIGGVYEKLGQYQDALKSYQLALGIAIEAQDKNNEGTILNNIGSVYFGLGQYNDALKNQQRAMDIFHEIGNRIGEGRAIANIGNTYKVLGRYQDALNNQQLALEIFGAIRDRAGEGTTLDYIGALYGNMGQYQEALEYYQQALDIRREIGDQAGEGATLNNIGGIYARLGQYQNALAYYQQATDIARRVGNQNGIAISLSNIGYVYELQTQFELALNFYRDSIDAYESIRDFATIEEIKIELASQSINVYQQTISMLLELERPAEAFNIAERARARTFLDQLANARVNPTGSANSTLVQQEEQLRGEIQALDKQLRDERAKPQNQRNEQVIRSVTAQLETKRAEYARLLTSIKLNNPEYASLVTVNPLTLTETQKILTNTTLVEYFVAVSQTVAFVVTQNDFHAVQITVTQDSLIKNIQNLYQFSSLEGVPAPLKVLYQHLIAPLKPYIKTDLTIIVPHSVLHYVPFGALHDEEHYLIEQYTLSYTPSASVLPFAFAKRKSSVAPPLILGDPDGSLPNSRQEAQAIAKMYGVTAYVGKDALERLVWERSKEAGVLHLSTHGVYNQRSPLFSNVLLVGDSKEDGHLDVYEIYNRGLNLSKADLVVLSACQTNVGELSGGDEIVGLSRALIYAGTPSVIASLWSVSDESTRVLMEKFYTHLRAGESKAGALRAAQMEMIASGTYAHPYHWAAFGVMGDPGVSTTASPSLAPTPNP